VVHSGGGLYPLWQFAQPPLITGDSLAEVKEAAQQWQALLAKTSEKLATSTGK
jgi:hypothetical protein